MNGNVNSIIQDDENANKTNIGDGDDIKIISNANSNSATCSVDSNKIRNNEKKSYKMSSANSTFNNRIINGNCLNGDLKIKEIREAIVKGISVNSLTPIRDAVSHLTRLDDFNVVKLSAGFFSEVFKVTHKSTRKVMVLKMNKQAVNRGNALKEIELLNKLNHPNIVAFMGTVVHEGQLHPLLEYLNFGTLESLIKRFYDQKVIEYLSDEISSHTNNNNNNNIKVLDKQLLQNTSSNSSTILSSSPSSSSSSSSATAACSVNSYQKSSPLNCNVSQDNQNLVNLFNKLAKDVALGMRYLHQLGYIHRDLTSRNIFIRRNSNLSTPITWDSQDLTAVIGDFGFAANEPVNSEQKLPTVGSPYWLSPECLRGFWYNHKSDIFSFGIICCELNWRVPADPDFLPRDNDFLVIFDKLPSHLNQTLLANIARLSTNSNPELRPEFSEIVNIFEECTVTSSSNLEMKENVYQTTGNLISLSCSDAGAALSNLSLSSVSSRNIKESSCRESDDLRNNSLNEHGDIFDQHLFRRQNSNHELIRQNNLCLTRKSISPQRVTH